MRFLALLFTATLLFGETVRFQRIAEPREGAFAMLVPTGWKASGGIARVNPMTGGGALNAIAAKLDFTVTSEDGRTALHWFPETNFFDMRGKPAQGSFPPGSNYNGSTVLPKMNATSFLQQVIFPRSRPRAEAARLKAAYPLPKAAQSYAQVVRQLGIPLTFQFDATLIVMTYRENGAAWEEALYTAIQDWGAAGAGLWTNKDTFSLRTPAGMLEKSGGVVSVMLNSVRLNPQWVEGEIRGQVQRGETAARTQQEIARLDREIVEHRQRTNAEISNQMYHNLMGTEEYVNPLTKQTEVGSNAWNYRWVNDRGEAVYTDDSSFDPLRAGLRGYVKSPVRKRFPDAR